MQQRRQAGGHLIGVIGLDGHQHVVARADLVWVISRGQPLQHEVAVDARYPQTPSLERLQMAAAGDEADVGAGTGELPAEEAADSTGSVDR